jgi:predicted phage terminase large subunit-like protein
LTPAYLDLPDTLTPSEAAEEIARVEIRLARLELLDFTAYTKPDYEINWHHERVAKALDRVLAGTCRRLMVLMPPQNGKSELVSRRFPAYAFGRKPDLRIVECSYAADLALAMSRDAQAIMATNEYQELFPGTRLADGGDQEKRTAAEFQVVGHRGVYIAAGVGGPIGGRTADIGIIDDPIKNREEAESEVMRDKLWEWYTSTFMARQFGNQGAIILCQTRWHEDDLAGRLLRLAAENTDADQWEVISLPALAEVADKHRRVGDALWPEKYPLAELKKRRATGGEYDWASLYQQRPAPSGGGLFKEEWFAGKFVDVAPANARRARGWDTAGTEGAGDWTCGVRIAEVDGIFYVEDVRRKQIGPSAVNDLMRTTTELDGKACAQREEKEGGSAGAAVVAARAKMLVGFDYAFVQISGSKVTRCKPFRAQCEAGNVRIVRGLWNASYVQELCGFPTAKHDDQVDASSCAFNAVLLEPKRMTGATWGR